MKVWERGAAEAKLASYRGLVLALIQKRENLDARIVFAERKVAEWERRVAEADE